VSADTVSRITDEVLDEVKACSTAAGRGLPGRLRRRAGREGPGRRSVRNKAVNIAIGIDTDGVKHVLGIWVAAAEGAKTWPRP